MARLPLRSAPLGCMHTLTIAVFPVLIYVCQWFGKTSSAASCLAGMLLMLKIGVELRHARQQQARSHTSRPRPMHSEPHDFLETVAGCYFCGKMQRVRSFDLDGLPVGVCQSCSSSLQASRRSR